MSAGQLRTPVYVMRVTRTTDAEGYPVEEETNVFGEGKVLLVRWVNAHGTDVYRAMTLTLEEPATITCRYYPGITQDCLIYKGPEERPYEIISIDNFEERGAWMEIKVQRRVKAR